MAPFTQDLARIVVIGIGATATMDAWLLFLQRLNVGTLNFDFIGRWVGHLARGTWAHDSIAKSAPVTGERALGWLTHYGVGIGFATLMFAVGGTGWTTNPSLLPAVLVGMATVVAPLFVLQPAMGAGIASSRTAAPVRNCIRSVANHTVFGVGLYLAATLVEHASSAMSLGVATIL